MANLITDLLAYTTATKSAEGPPPLTDSDRVLNQVLQSMNGAIERAGAIITSAGLPVVPIHESRLAQLFQNLIANALKYRSKEAPRVFVTALDQDGWTVFSVKDNGIGIDPEYGSQIFGLFKRLHNREQYPGSGLGLAICQRTVEQYGGRIWLDSSAVGAGSTFCFALPARSG
jgi:light-regulated signal transduction histidine kinase (bacteriophytochrome)